MVTPRSMTSIRLSDEELAALDERVGLAGHRSRSDVIRAALTAYLSAGPVTPGVRTITLEVGMTTQHQLGVIHQHFGYDAQQALQAALTHYMQTWPEVQAQMLTQWDGMRQPGYDGASGEHTP